uniref:Uncharacterized protein n=1 Tax=Rhizophora mucronata TaxID=61149 RepID=A0A2P2P4Q9_RHIMU
MIPLLKCVAACDISVILTHGYHYVIQHHGSYMNIFGPSGGKPLIC